MKEITATDAARGFSALLDAVEHEGETFVVTRGGKGVARIEPAAGASGADVKSLLRRHRLTRPGATNSVSSGGRTGPGPTVARLILDTTVLVAAERSREHLGGMVADEDDIVIAAITAAELLVGVHSADDARRVGRTGFVDEVLATIPIEDYDLRGARAHAELLAHVRRTGRSRPSHDLVIAAAARATSRSVVSADAGAFADLPGVAHHP